MELKKSLMGIALGALWCGSLTAAPLLTEGFETYHHGALDTELPGGPNNNTNNPWAGPFEEPDNLQVVGAESSPNGIAVTPHGGTNMVRGSLRAADFDQDFYNLEYWLNATNGNAPFFGNFVIDWWFFDSVGLGTNGANPTQFCDSLTVSFYDAFPPNQPYNSDIAIAGVGGPTTSLGIGGDYAQDVIISGTNEASGYDSTKYQAYGFGVPGNGYDGLGWFNIPSAVRSVGWHHARIEVLPARGDSSVDAALYVDNMVTPGLRLNASAPEGFNSIGMNANFAGPAFPSTNITAYYDDVAFTLLPAPTFTKAVVGNNLILSWDHSWILQSTTNIGSDVWTDIVDSQTNFVNSPYTNALGAKTQLFFRLRN